MNEMKLSSGNFQMKKILIEKITGNGWFIYLVYFKIE